MTKPVGVNIDGEPTWHAPGGMQDYATLRGIDPDDDQVGHFGLIEPHRGQKITCEQCKIIWDSAKQVRASDFAK